VNVLIAGLVAAVVAFVLLWLPSALLHRRELKRRVALHDEPPRREQVEHRPGLRGRFARPLGLVEERFRGRRWWRSLDRMVDAAGLGLRTAEVLAVAVGGLLAVIVLASVAGFPPVTAVLLALAVAISARLALSWRISRRLAAFEEQLPDVLSSLASALRAGHSFSQALQAVAADVPAPAGPELQRVLAEARFGRPIDEALAALGERTRSSELSFVLTAVSIQRQVGGSLAGLFETVSDTVRQRQQFARKLRSLTAMGRASAAVLMAIPIGLALLFLVLNSDYMQPLFDTGVGRLLVVYGLVSMTVGALWLRRIVGVKS
jgi:tight adherence protein B